MNGTLMGDMAKPQLLKVPHPRHCEERSDAAIHGCR
jgi:hypothetical protein